MSDVVEQLRESGTMNDAVTPHETEFCELSQRVDGMLHSWRFDGDSPIIVCHFCGERRDALTGRAIGGEREARNLPNDTPATAEAALAEAIRADPELFRLLWPDEHGVDLAAERILAALPEGWQLLSREARAHIEAEAVRPWREALELQKEGTMPDGSACFCVVAIDGDYTVHAEHCREARALLAEAKS